ncbi:hypothetical protein FYJ24_07090 [Actinomycetaceae bacterium WB03_NA08]|uniref:IrrE N-terminal-like domain-containing protein n=1 Tax=Scrofimicrobium canadense TaxID=2652290 RepID=A0A6N7W7P9_9ACTO|nr:hypothetical protein [Scrofimicrobium canadense]MSS84533.1 hypothetical protein [Scrofimicrobium canadense]
METLESDLSELTPTIDIMNGISEDEVIERLAQSGIRVEYAELPRGMWGFYSLEWRLVTLRVGMPHMYRLPTLLHECGHVARMDNGHQCSKVEKAIDEDVALALINPADFKWAETHVGYHTGGIAHELEVPKWVVRAYRRVLLKQMQGAA